MVLSGLCWTVLDTLHRKLRELPQIVGFYTAKSIDHIGQIIRV